MNAKKLIGTALSVVLCASMLAGCGNQKNETETTTEKGKKTLVIGDTTFNSSNEENNVNPHDAYSGWACIRYGIGETLVKYSDTMEIEPWLAKEWENVYFMNECLLFYKIFITDIIGILSLIRQQNTCCQIKLFPA